MNAAPDRLPLPAASLLVLLCATWALGQITMKIGLEGISPMVQAGLRSVITIPCLLAWCAWRGVAVFRRDGSLGAGALAGFFFALEFWALYEALALTTAARVTVMLYTAPFWAALGAHFFVAGDRLTPRKAAGLALAFAGLVAAFGDKLAGGPTDTLAGDVLALAGGALWGATIVVIKATRLTRIAPERTLLYQLTAVLALLPLGYAMGEPGVFDPNARVVGALLFQSVVVAGISFTAWFWLVARHKASLLAPFLFLTPAFGVGFAALLLGEPVTWFLLLSLGLIGAGIFVVNRG